jgi:hypothetical protein
MFWRWKNTRSYWSELFNLIPLRGMASSDKGNRIPGGSLRSGKLKYSSIRGKRLLKKLHPCLIFNEREMPSSRVAFKWSLKYLMTYCQIKQFDLGILGFHFWRVLPKADQKQRASYIKATEFNFYSSTIMKRSDYTAPVRPPWIYKNTSLGKLISTLQNPQSRSDRVRPFAHTPPTNTQTTPFHPYNYSNISVPSSW